MINPDQLSPEEMIEEGFGLIARGLFSLDKVSPKEAEFELHVLTELIADMHVTAMRKSQTVGGMPFPGRNK